jgi:hypothetical protein
MDGEEPQVTTPKVIDLGDLAHRPGFSLSVTPTEELAAKQQELSRESEHRRSMEKCRFWVVVPSVLAAAMFLAHLILSKDVDPGLKNQAFSGFIALVTGSAGFLTGRASKSGDK